MSSLRIVEISGDMIRLGQFLKLADLVDHGSEVRPLVLAGSVLVNDAVETRRGRQLSRGDTVTVLGQSVRVGRATTAGSTGVN